MEAFTALVIITLLPSATLAGPVYSWDDPLGDVPIGSQCSSICIDRSNFGYTVGQRYRYSYEIKGVSSLSGTSDQSSTVLASALADIHVLSKCEFVLKLSDVAFKTSDPDSNSLREVSDIRYSALLEENTLSFSFQDGRVDKLCPGDREQKDVLNFKRAILSAFQNSMTQHNVDQSLREIDVSGNCPTDYVIAQKGTRSTQITKTKDLLGCTERVHFRTSLQSTAYHVPEAIQSLPLLKGEYKCSITLLKDGILSYTTCTESLIFRPFSKKEAGAKTESTQILKFISSAPSYLSVSGDFSRMTSLIFEHVQVSNDADVTMWTVRDKILELCNADSSGVSKQSPGLFNELVYLMKQVSTDLFQDVYDGIVSYLIPSEQREVGVQYFMDALPLVGTEGSVNLMIDLIINKQITNKLQTSMWIRSIGFLQEPTSTMLKTGFKRLLTSNDNFMEALLPVTSAVNTYCGSQINCEYLPEVKDIVNALGDVLGNDCSGPDEKTTLKTLRAALNLGHSDGLETILAGCLKKSNNKLSVRVASTEAFKAISCSLQRTILMDVLSNKDEDSELRINAYLSQMKCPTQDVIQKVKTILEKEEVNQVGSFIWSHLTNLAESSNPFKQDIKDVLQDEELKKEFNLNQMKYSRNYELSYFSKNFGSGATAESNVIWSSSSFLPRSAMLNLTVDVLGHSMNLFEVGGRAEGLQQALHNIISNTINDYKNKGKDSSSKSCGKKSKMDAMKNKHGVEGIEPSVSFYLRLLGKEIDYKRITPYDLQDLKRNPFSFLKSLKVGNDVSFSHSAMFIDSAMTVPTIGGMALQLTVNGSATVQLKVDGKLGQVTNGNWKPFFNLEPSAAVQIGGEMTLNAGVMKSGLKMLTTLHTNTAVTGKLDLTNNQVLTITADTPRETMDIFNLQSEFFVVHTNAVEKQKPLDPKAVFKSESCSGDSLLTAIGYQMCQEMTFTSQQMMPNAPYWPFTGPAAIKFVLHKKDAPQGFKLSAERVHTKKSMLGRFSVDSPGSKVDRKLSANYAIDSKAYSLEMDVSSPWKKVEVKGSYSNKLPKDLKISGSLAVDQQMYDLSFSLDKDLKDGNTIWTPMLQLERPKESLILAKTPESLSIGGPISLSKKLDDISADIDLMVSSYPKPRKMKFSYVNKKATKTLSADFIDDQKKGYSASFQLVQSFDTKNNYPTKLKPTVLISFPKWRPILLSGNIDYKKDKIIKSSFQIVMDNTLKSPIDLTFKIQKAKSKFRINGKLTSQFGTIKSRGFVEAPANNNNKKGVLLTTKITTSYNLHVIPVKELRKNLVVVSSKIHDRSSKSLMKYDANIVLESRKYQAASFIASAHLSHKDSYTKSVITYRGGPKAKNVKDTKSQLKVETTLNHKIKPQDVVITYDTQILYPIKSIEWQINGKHEHHLKKLSIETYNAFIYAKGKSSEIRLKIDDSSKKHLQYNGLLEFNYPTFEFQGQKINEFSYKMDTSLHEKEDKDYSHTFQIYVNKNLQHSAYSKYKIIKEGNEDLWSTDYSFNSKINIHENDKVKTKITFETSRVDKQRETLIKVNRLGEYYKIDLTRKIDNKMYMNDWDVVWPERRVKGMLNFGLRQEGQHAMKFMTMWDANKDQSKVIEVDYNNEIKEKVNDVKYDIEMSVKTPFKGYNVFTYKRLFELNKNEVKDELKMVFQQEQNEVSYKFWLKKPFSLQRIHSDFEFITPIEALRMFRVELRHKSADFNAIETSLKSKINKNDVSFDVIFANKQTKLQNKQEYNLVFDFKGAKRNSLEFKIGDFPETLSYSPLFEDFPKRIKVGFNHNDNKRQFDSEFVFFRDESESKLDLHTTYLPAGKMITLKSNLNIKLPHLYPETVTFNLDHMNSLTNLNTTLSSTWAPNTKVKLDIGATVSQYDQTLYIHYSGTTPEIFDLIYKVHQNSFNGYSGSSFSEINKNPKMRSSQSYKITKTDFFYESSAPQSKSLIKVEYEKFPYTGYMKYDFVVPEEGNVWKHITVSSSVEKNKEQDWTGDLQLMTPFDKVKNINVKGNLKNSGQNQWELDGDISNVDLNHKIEIKAAVDADKWSKMDVEVNNPWMDVGLNVVHRRNKRGAKTDATLKYGGKEIIGKFNGKLKLTGRSNFDLDLTFPYETIPTANLKGVLTNRNDKWTGNVELKTGNKDLKSLKVDFDHFYENPVFETGVKVTSSLFDKVDLRTRLNWNEDSNGLIKIAAPQIGENSFGFERLSSTSWTDFHYRYFGLINGKEFDMDLGLKNNERITKLWSTFAIPGADKSYFKTSMHRIGNSLMDFDIGGDLQIGKDTVPFNASAQFSYIEGKTTIGTTFTSPFTKGFSYLLNQKVSKTSQTSIIYGNYGDEYKLDVYDMVELQESKYVATRRAGYLLHGKGHTHAYDIKAEWSDKGEELEFEYKWNDDIITAVGSHVPQSESSDDQDTVDLSITTTFENFKDLELHSYVEQLNENSYEGKLIVEYMDNKKAELVFDVKKIRNKIIGNGELTLPIKGYEKTEIHYNQINRKNLIAVDVDAITPKGDTVKANMKLRKGNLFELSLTGPIKQFESFKVSGNYVEKDQHLKGDVKLWLSLHPKPVTLSYDGQVNDDNLLVTLNLRSPYENYRQVDLTLDHKGFDMKKFSTTTKFSSDVLGTYESINSLNLESPLKMEGKFSLSTPSNKYGLSLESNSESEYIRNTELEINWDSNKKISFKSSWDVELDYYGVPKTVAASLDMTSPFKELKTLGITFSESKVNAEHSRSILVKHNGIVHLDSDMKYYMEGEIHKASLDIRKPNKMTIDIEGKQKDRTFDGKMFLNWDKKSPESQFEFNLHFADKSDASKIDTDFYIKLIHPVRIMSVEYLIRSAEKEMQSSGLVTWDESGGNTFSYDVGYTNRSTRYSSMYNAHVKVGVPHRSVKLLGSFGDTGSSRTMTGTALWDADKDESKKVSLSTSHEYSERNERLSLNLNLPSINKQMNVGVVAQRKYGTSILDSRTEITYSSDPRKTLIITNKLYDSLKGIAGDQNYNYTLVTGFKHAITDTDIEWLSHYSRLNTVQSVGSQFTYLDLNHDKNIFSWRVQTDQDKSGQFMFVTPVKSINLIGMSSFEDTRPTYTIKLFEDGRKTMALTGKVSPETKQLDATMHYDRDDPSKEMYMNAAYVSDRSLEISIYDDAHMYAKLNANLNSSHIVHNRIQWKPSLPDDIKIFLGTKVTTFTYAVKDNWESAVKTLGTEVKAKYLKVSEELREEIGQVFALMRMEMKVFSEQLDMLRTHLRRMYARNDFNIKDMGRRFDAAIQEILAAINQAITNYQNYYRAVAKATIDWIQDLKKYPIAVKYQQFINSAMNMLVQTRKHLENVLKVVAVELGKISEALYQQYIKIERVVDRKLNSYKQSKDTLAIYKLMMRERIQLASIGAKYDTKDMEKFDEAVMQFQQLLEDQFHDIMERLEYRHAHAMGTEIYQQFKYWSVQGGLINAFKRLLDLSKNLFLMELGKLKNILMDMKKSQLTYFDPAKAELHFELYLPFEMEAFSKPPEFEIGQSIKDSYKWLENRLIPGKNTTLLEMYEGYIPSLKSSDWLPPFEATGYLVGSQHVITFDKTFIDFSTQCSHVLVRDMLYDTFSVVVNYDNNQVKSLCFSFGNSLYMEVDKNYQLTVNNQESEMPFINDIVRVVRDGDTISVRYADGIEVVTNPSIDVHKVVLSGWYHGRVAGLLGSYDNEKHNDMAMVDRLHEFEVNNKKCNSGNSFEPNNNFDKEGVCGQLFSNEDLPYGDCYEEVNPNGFLHLCNLYTSSMKYQDAMYKVTEQYRSVCRDAGVFLEPVIEISNCVAEPKQNTDVLFIVQDAACNQWISPFLTRIVTEMDKALTTKNEKSDNQFGLIGYEEGDLTTRTIKGQHFGKSNLFLRAVETLRFTNPHTSGDLVTALEVASTYPFRSDAANRILVLVPCTSCNQLGYFDWGLYDELEQQGFQIHTLQDMNFAPHNDERKRQLTVYGMSQEKTITNRGWYLTTPEQIQEQIQDRCQPLTQQFKGLSFDSAPLKRRSKRIQNSFIKSFAMSVTDTPITRKQRC